MKSLLFGRTVRRLFSGLLIAALGAAGLAASPALMAQCPAGQTQMLIPTATGVVRTAVVPGSAGGVPSGIMIQPGHRFVMVAAGSIRVGVFGETGTSPDGWVPQGAAGNGFPDPDSPTFSLIYRIGPTGPWQLLGTGESVALLGPHDPPGSQIYFGVNDNKLSDNTGVFIVTLTELANTPRCVTPQPPPQYPTYGMSRSYSSSSGSGSSGSSSGTAALPCAGQTPNGRPQSFQFTMSCPGFTQNIPVEACSRSAALPIAQAFASNDHCLLTTN